MKKYRNERQLIEACLQKRRKAQFALYERYKVAMYAVCMRYAKTEAQAQDFLQEGFIKVFKSLGQYRFEVAIEYWMKRVVANACISELRRKKDPLNKVVSIEQLPEQSQASEIEINTSGLKAKQLIQLIQQLPDGYRSIFNLYALEGYSHQEISEIMNISAGTSRSQYARAKKLLAKQINQIKTGCHEA